MYQLPRRRVSSLWRKTEPEQPGQTQEEMSRENVHNAHNQQQRRPNNPPKVPLRKLRGKRQGEQLGDPLLRLQTLVPQEMHPIQRAGNEDPFQIPMALRMQASGR